MPYSILGCCQRHHRDFWGCEGFGEQPGWKGERVATFHLGPMSRVAVGWEVGTGGLKAAPVNPLLPFRVGTLQMLM